MSELSGDLIAALVKSQSEFPRIDKAHTAKIPTKAGGSYQYEYADLADVLAAVRPVLSRNELAIFQRPSVEAPPDRASTISVETILAHTSGASISSTLAVPANDLSIQSVGSAISYLRRYTLISILGVAPSGEDDDGAAANHPPPKPPATASKKSNERPGATENQLRLVWAKARAIALANVEEGDAPALKELSEQIVREALGKVGVKSSRELKMNQVDQVIGAIEKLEDVLTSSLPAR